MRQLGYCGVLCFLGLALSAKSALAADPPTGGVEVGANINKYSFSGSDADSAEADFKAGLVIGGFVAFPVTPMVAIQPEVVYAQKHAKLKGTGSDNGFTANLNIDVVEIPILAKIDFSA